MTILNAADLEFAKQHITKFYDSDFFPKPFEFDALWMNWTEVVAALTSKNIQKLPVSNAATFAAPKPGESFRVVHQLEPMDALAYTAIVASVCADIESARMPVESQIACSYRISKADGSFFSGGAGWDIFTEQTERLAADFPFVLVLDITDFYNQISLHRVNNAIAYANPALNLVAIDAEKFLLALNSKNSQGVPVGPAASIVLAEGVLIDVDQYVQHSGFRHTRYVDDFRVFSDSRAKLEKFNEAITLYLYNSHRLSIAREKSAIMESIDFLQRRVHDQTAEERAEIFSTLEVFNPYSEEFEKVEVNPDDFMQFEQIQARVHDVVDRLLGQRVLDLGIARAVIRTAKRSGVGSVASKFLGSFCFLSPVVNDLCIYLDKVVDVRSAPGLAPVLEGVLDQPCMKHELVRYWMAWLIARHVHELHSESLRVFVYESGWLEHAAVAAVRERNLAWVRSYKSQIFQMTPRARRAVLFAGQILPRDELDAWISNTIQNATSDLDRWMAIWVKSLPESGGYAFT